ncbi:MAG: class I SAM-dependent methyltransferase [Clostridia bacterium]|nr:class I SAM-dependent methyltransferase [Clostridia bacterium]MDY5554522.1 class I SAM-dependent methyltransferase [Blautia sp.]
MQLSSRLSAVAGMVTRGNRLVDVGCDHGYLPVYLYLNRIIPGAIAMDVRKGPLSRAKEHIAQYGLEKYIETRLSDGLQALGEGEGDTLVMAGMGGPLMERILTEGAKVRESFREMVLAPQSDLPHFRRFISEIGWETVKEDLILEDGKFYPIMKVVHGTKKYTEPGSPYTCEERFGELLLKQRHPVLKEYLKRELGICDSILEKLENAPSAKEREQEIKEERQAVLSALEIYESI